MKRRAYLTELYHMSHSKTYQTSVVAMSADDIWEPI